MVFKRSFFGLCLFSIVVLSFSCKFQNGMGEALDLEAPEITILSPEKNAYVHSDAVFSGGCTDNIGVTSIVVTNDDFTYTYGNATITDNTWTFSVKLKEGENTLRFTANDAAENTSGKSSKTITVIVDDTAPESLEWYVDRGNGIQIALASKEELENIDTSLSINKDIPQNEKFTIYGHFQDAISVKSVTVSLAEDDQTVIQKTLNSEDLSEDESLYTPAITFTHSELVAAKESLNTGKHYLQVSYSVSDEHGNVGSNTLSYVLWYPESDIPGIEQTQIVNNYLSVNIGSAIPFTFFDDDGLTDVYYAFLNDNTTVNYSNLYEMKDNPIFTHLDKTSYRDYPEQISSKETEKTGRRYLAACVRDVNNKWNKIFVTVDVVDASYPILIIESPSENAVPEIKTGTISTFEIKGYSNDSTGSKGVKIAYIPDSEEYKTSYQKEERAKQIFGGAATQNGEIYKSVEFTAEKTKSPESQFVQEPFTFEFDLINDFGSAGKEPKFFELVVEDTEGNLTYRQFRVEGDSLLPEIVIDTPDDGAVCDYGNKDLIIKFKAVKESGLGIKSESYKIERKDVSGFEYTLANGGLVQNGEYVVLTINKDTARDWAEGNNGFIANTQPVFILSAEDVLQNANSKRLSVVLSPLPVLESITTERESGTYKANDTIILQAKFTDSVKVTGTPRIALKYSNASVNIDDYADYSSGTNSNTLNFTFEVPEGKTSTGIICESIELNGGKIETASIGMGNASIVIPSQENLKNKIIAFDGVYPRVTGISLTVSGVDKVDGKYYVPADKEITAEVTCSKPLSISGSPELLLKAGSEDIAFKLKDINGNKISFSHKVTSSSPQGDISYDYGTMFADSEIVKIFDSVGNVLKSVTPANPDSEYGKTNITIMNEKPSTPVISGITAGNKNENQTFTVAGSSSCTVEYSKDGGVSWLNYSSGVTLGSGYYQVTARQKDKAGNISDPATVIAMTINADFPTLSGFSIGKTDGSYPATTVVDFKLFIEEKVKVTTATAASLTFVSNADNTKTKTINAEVDNSGSTCIVFKYTVATGDYFEGIKVTDISLTNAVEDMYGNTPTSSTVTQITSIKVSSDAKRTALNFDAVKPGINNNGYSPAKAGISSSENNAFTVTLTFNENVFKESGKITLQRKGDWAIPAYFTVDDFMKVYNQVSAADKQRLIRTDSYGLPITDAETGISVGPYKKITHGIKIDGSEYVPDTATKYVLDFNLGLYDGEITLNPEGTSAVNVGNTASVSEIREILKSIDYDKHIIDVSSSQVQISGNVVTITFTDVIEDGRNWDLIIDAGAFRDSTGNTFDGIAEGDYSFWSNKVAQPVVRVNRYSHGLGAYGKDSSGNEVKISGYTLPKTRKNLPASASSNTSSSGAAINPLGYCKFRIDCETPEVTINYKVVNSGTKAWSDVGKASVSYTDKNENDSNISSISNIAASSLEIAANTKLSSDALAVSYTDGAFIKVGDGLYTTASKDYVIAQAEKTNFTDSILGREGIFKTTIIIYKSNSSDQINIEGGTAKGGVPNIDGFPLRDATADRRYSKNMYSFADNSTNYFAWVTYEIVSESWVVLQHRDNYSSDYPKHKFGQILYLYNYSTWE